jgi:hypothetical protein
MATDTVDLTLNPPPLTNDEVSDDEATMFTVKKLSRQLKAKGALLSTSEAMLLVSHYYQMQSHRIRAGGQIRAKSAAFFPANMATLDEQGKETAKAIAMSQSRESFELTTWYEAQAMQLENEVKKVLHVFSMSSVLGCWARSILGIGPVIAAGLLSHVDVTKTQTSGGVHKFAGLVNDKWLPKCKRPWNAALKTLSWKLGESFVKTSNKENDFYGHIVMERRAIEIANNDAGLYAEQAAQKLIEKPDHAQAAIYKLGKLPPGHILSRSKRFGVKLFLAHYFEVAFELTYARKPPLPYPIAHLGHVHIIQPPNWPEILSELPSGLPFMPK